MKHSAATEQLFDQVIADTPSEIKREVEWSYQIADKIYAALRRKGLSQKEFARLVGTSEAAVSKWIGGGHNFTLATLAKIEEALGEEVMKIYLENNFFLFHTKKILNLWFVNRNKYNNEYVCQQNSIFKWV